MTIEATDRTDPRPPRRGGSEGFVEPARTSVIVTDPAGVILAWNLGAERLYGWTQEEMRGRHILDALFRDEDLAQGAEIIRQLRERLIDEWSGRLTLQHKYWHTVEVFARDTPIERGDDRIAYLGESIDADLLRPLEADLAALLVREGIVAATAEATRRWVTAFLASSRDAVTTQELDAVLDEALSAVANSLDADGVALLLADEEGTTLIQRASYGWPFDDERPLSIPAGVGVSGRVLSTRQPLVVPDLDDVTVASAALRQSGFHSYVGVPLVVGDTVLGVLHATSRRHDQFTTRHVEALAFLAGHLAAAIDRVQLLEAERRTTGRLRALQGLLARLARARTIEEIGDAVLGEPLATGEPAAGAVWEHAASGPRLVRSVGRSDDGADRAAPPEATGAVFDGRREGVVASLPLEAGAGVVGHLVLVFAGRAKVGADEAAHLATVAEHAALAIERVRGAERERRAAAAARERSALLADALGPALLPEVPGAELFAAYQPADQGRVGGDWYDVFPLPGGRVGLSVGDVAGHGIEAAAGMTMIRNALYLYAQEGASPADALRRLREVTAGLPEPAFGPALATVLLGTYDPASRTLLTASAGHLPFLHARGATTRFVASPGVPLGRALPNGLGPYEERATELEAGDLVVLYTDGLVEARGEVLDDGLDRLARAARGHAGRPLADLSAHLLEQTAAGPRRDDVSLLLLRQQTG